MLSVLVILHIKTYGRFMLDFNLDYYRTFYYVAKFKSISKAAGALYLSQPAVTRSIKQLENHLRCSLFRRTYRGMLLTNEGNILYTHVSKAIEELIIGEQNLQLTLKYVEGTLKIGATETALHHFLIPKIERFNWNYPNVHIQLSGSSTPEILRMLRDDKVDLVVGVSPISDTDGLEIVQLATFKDIFIAGSRFENLRGVQLTAKDLIEFSIVTVEKETSARVHIEHWFESQGILFNPEYVVRTSTAILPFVERNLAIGIVPYMFAEELLKQSKIFELQLSLPIEPRKILLVYKNVPHLSTQCHKFIEYMLIKK